MKIIPCFFLTLLSPLYLTAESAPVEAHSTCEDACLRKECRRVLLHEMIKSRLEERFSLPPSFVEKSASDPLSFLIKEIGAIRGIEFTEEELSSAKEKVCAFLLTHIEVEQEEKPSSGFLAFEITLRLMGAISLDEIEEELEDFFNGEEEDEFDFEDEDDNIFHLREGENVPTESLNIYGQRDEEDIEDPFLKPLDPADDPNMKSAQFSDLPLVDWEKKIIAHIVSNMADKNVFELLLEKRDMESKGRQIHHVHPLRFMGYVFSEPRLKRHMKAIKKNPFKWDGFINGFAARMREEGARNNLTRFIPGFAEHLQIDPAEVGPFIQRGDSDGLVRFLIGS